MPSSEGLALWHEFAASVESEMRPGGAFEHFRDWSGKLPGQALRLAGLLHLFKAPGQGTIDSATVQAAIGLAALCADHANAVFALMGAAPEVECARKILAWVQRNGKESFSVRDCFNSLRGSFPKVEELNKGFGVLVERYCIFEAPQETKQGRPSKVYRVHPDLLEVKP